MPRYAYHPACLLFPKLGDAELQELAADIREHGLRNPIVLYNGKILDGRNRLAACKIAKVKPRFVKWTGIGSPVDWVISENLMRRHLTSSQRAVVAHDLLPLLEREAKERQRLSPGRGAKVAKKLAEYSKNGSGKSSQIAARLTRTNSAYVEAIKSVARIAPDLLDGIRSGILKVPDAMILAQLPKRRRQKILGMVQADPEKKLKRIIREAELATMRSASKPSTNGKARDADIQVWCEDCLTAMRSRIGDATISTVVTSPPYNIGVQYNRYQDDRPHDEYLDWLDEVFQEVKRVLADDGSFFLNVGSSRTRPWNAVHIAEVAGRHFRLQNEIVWVKSIAINGTTYGHFTPLAGNKYLNHNFESVYHFTKTGKVRLDRLAVGVPYEYASNLTRNRAGGNLRCAGDVWFIPYETVQDRGNKGYHPAVFPVELAERCIRLAGVRRNAVVLDPFMGSASTLMACKELRLRGIGIDTDPAYCKQARRRLGMGR